jgi:integrase
VAVSKVSDDARDDRYEVRLYNPLGGRYKKVVRGKRAAERHELEVRAVLASGGMAAGPQRTVTVEELMEQILAARPNLSPNTLRSYRNSLRLHLYPALGSQQVRRLTSGLALTAVLERVEQRSGREARRAAESLLRLLLKTAVRERVLDRNPLDGLPFPRRSRVRGLPYAPEMVDVHRVLQALARPGQGALRGEPEMAVTAVTLLIGAGLRIGELLALSPELDYDAGRRTLSISRQLQYLPGQGFVFAPPKTDDSGVRSIPLPSFAAAAIARSTLLNGHREVTLPWRTPEGSQRTLPLLLFSLRERGQPYRPQTLQDKVRRAGQQLELPGALHPHGFRHRYTALLHDAGVPQIVIDEVTGHLPSGSVSMRTYTRAMDRGREQAREALQAAWQTAASAPMLRQVP